MKYERLSEKSESLFLFCIYNLMEKDWQHLGALLGRTFIVASSENLPYWNGHSDESESDYESIADLISTEEGNMTLYQKAGRQFYIFFSMATKVELFRKGDSLFIIDGLLFNKSLEGVQNIQKQETEKISFNVSMPNSWLNVFDATLTGNEMGNNKTEGLHSAYKSDYYSYASIKLKEGNYSVYRIILTCKLDGEEGELYGIELRKET
ncbi:MAG TPA: hypothetical protein VK174_16210 [Chitinophagales bacterium]|nr:hypothetical protein [Chitinophagales bacterium]